MNAFDNIRRRRNFLKHTALCWRRASDRLDTFLGAITGLGRPAIRLIEPLVPGRGVEPPTN